MTILFVLLTFLVVMAITYYTRHPQPAQPSSAFAPAATPGMVREFGFEIPKGYCFHPGHTWVLDEGLQNGRVGMDGFAANLIGRIERIEVTGLNRWVRQGQKIWSITVDGTTFDMVSPVEGVVHAVNSEVQRDPKLIAKDPYKDGWVCVVKSPDMDISLKNLLRENYIAPWMQNTLRRLSTLTAQMAGATAQDGGLPVAGLLAKVDAGVRQTMVREFFLT